jgi:flagellar hook-basal body complex protein FliE
MNAIPVLPPVAGSLGTLRVAPEARVPREIPVPELQPLPWANAAGEAGRTTSPAPFGEVLSRMVGEVNQRQLAAADKVQGLLGGREVSLHETMIALEEASVSFQLMVEVRNKLLESYQELMRMQV